MVVVPGIGIIQGGIISKALRTRYPDLKKHAKLFSLALLTLFSINAVVSIVHFVNPNMISDEENPVESGDPINWAISLLGLNAGFVSVLSISLTVTIFAFMRLVKLSGISRSFVLSISIGLMILNMIYRVGGLVPDLFQIAFYILYQIGFTAGIFLVASRELGLGGRMLQSITSWFGGIGSRK